MKPSSPVSRSHCCGVTKPVFLEGCTDTEAWPELLQMPFPGIAQAFEHKTSFFAASGPPALGACKDLPTKGLGMGPALATLGVAGWSP